MPDDTEMEMIRVPQSAEEMLPPMPSSLISEAAAFLRSHWEEVKPFYECISGESPSMHGSVTLDEAACVFKIKAIAELNGFAFLGTVPTVKLRRALRYAYKRNTGTPIHKLETQYKLLTKQRRRDLGA